MFDWKEKNFQFYDVKILSMGYKKLDVIIQYGKFNTKGKEQIIAHVDNYKEAEKIAYKKVLDRKYKGYKSLEKIQEATDAVNSYEPRYVSKTEKNKNVQKENHRCPICHKNIPEHVYEKINEWARGEGNWDNDENFLGYQKVICIDCQIDHDIFKKRIPKK